MKKERTQTTISEYIKNIFRTIGGTFATLGEILGGDTSELNQTEVARAVTKIEAETSDRIQKLEILAKGLPTEPDKSKSKGKRKTSATPTKETPTYGATEQSRRKAEKNKKDIDMERE